MQSKQQPGASGMVNDPQQQPAASSTRSEPEQPKLIDLEDARFGATMAIRDYQNEQRRRYARKQGSSLPSGARVAAEVAFQAPSGPSET